MTWSFPDNSICAPCLEQLDNRLLQPPALIADRSLSMISLYYSPHLY